MSDKFNLSDPEAVAGVVVKTGNLAPMEVTPEDLKKINKYTLEPVTADQVYAFKMTMADNEQDDRNFMPFNLKALQDLKKLYPGKTMLKDHNRMADNQIARVFDTDLIQDTGKTTELGEFHTELIGKAYMIKTASNEDLIAEIKGGIKKEVSTSTKPEKMVCSICKGDGLRCRHWPGVEYTVEDGSEKGTKRRCKMVLHGAKEAYELSFVAVPAQPRAGTHKALGFAKANDYVPEEPTEEPINNESEQDETIKDMDLRLLDQRVKNAESFLFSNEREEQ